MQYQPYASYSMPTYPERAKKLAILSWHLYKPIESLKTIPSSVIFLQDAIEVT